MKKIILALVISIFMVSVSFAAGHSAKEAKELVDKAVIYIKDNGKDKALTEFNNPSGAFSTGGLYIFAIDFNGIALANGATPDLVGKDLKGLKDSQGRLFTVEMIKLAKSKKGKGWINYNWLNKETKKVEPKASYIRRVDHYFVGCGITIK